MVLQWYYTIKFLDPVKGAVPLTAHST